MATVGVRFYLPGGSVLTCVRRCRLKEKEQNIRFLVQDMEGIGEPVPMGCALSPPLSALSRFTAACRPSLFRRSPLGMCLTQRMTGGAPNIYKAS